MSTDYDKWIERGERLGLKDKELRDFVKEQQDTEREERQQRRQVEATGT